MAVMVLSSNTAYELSESRSRSTRHILVRRSPRAQATTWSASWRLIPCREDSTGMSRWIVPHCGRGGRDEGVAGCAALASGEIPCLEDAEEGARFRKTS